jgi:hypothetical protein
VAGHRLGASGFRIVVDVVAGTVAHKRQSAFSSSVTRSRRFTRFRVPPLCGFPGYPRGRRVRRDRGGAF